MQSANEPEAATVKFRFKNLGPVKEAELELGDLTIIAGRNNTGKTYLAYTLYGFLKMWARIRLEKVKVPRTQLEDFIGKVLENRRGEKCEIDRDSLIQERKSVIREVSSSYSKDALSGVFNSPDSAFEGASFEVELSNELPEGLVFQEEGPVYSIYYDGTEVQMTYDRAEEYRLSELWVSDVYLQFLFPELSFDPFVLSAERFGISLFYKELDLNKNRMVELLWQKADATNKEYWESVSPYLMLDIFAGRYALPIKDNINYTRSISYLEKEKSEILEDKIFDGIKDMMEGYYRSAGDDIRFRSKARKEGTFNIPLHRASSSARGLSDLYFFLRHVVKKNHLLIIDEPESHLDTANQIEFARLLARLVRAGVKVLITTHSDYIIKEINNLIMLSQSFEDKNKIVKKLKYKKNDFLPAESVRAYVAEDSSLTPCKIDEFGIDMPFFDKTINDINRASNELATRVAREGVE